MDTRVPRIVFFLKAARAGQQLLKAADIPPGARWITVHPNGEGKGQPVLVQPVAPGSHAVHVIGGAGGKLNYLRLSGVKSPEHYAKEAAERGKQRRAEAKEQKAKDKAAGVLEAKQAAKGEVSEAKRAAEKDFVQTVADAMGWNHDDLAFDEDAHKELSPAALDKARGAHERAVLSRAKEAVKLQRRRLLVDADARKSAFSGDMPLFTDDATKLSVQDLDPVRMATGLGFDPDFKGRSEAAGLTDAEAHAEKDAVVDLGKEPDPAPDPDKAAAKEAKTAERADTAAKLKAELAAANLDKPDLPAKLVDVQQAVALLKAEKKLAGMQKAAREANKAIDQNPEPKAYVLQVSAASDADVEKEIAQDLRTAKTRAFLEQAMKDNPEGGAMENHVAEGGFNAINSLSLVAGGTSMLDRSVVDVLGIQGAAQVLARRLRSGMSDEEADNLAENVADFHVQHYEQLSVDALDKVAELHAQAEEFDLGSAAGAEDLLVKAELNRKRVGALEAAQKLLGRSLGEMEANAAMVQALREKPRNSVQVSLGRTPLLGAIRALRALGLQKGDYKLEKAAGGTFVSVNWTGMDRLAKPADRENVDRLQRNVGIMRGDQDEDGWLPQGFANRADLAMDLMPGVADSLAVPFAPGDDLAASLKEYIGGRAADGDKPADIVADLQSAEFYQKVGADRAKEYRTALDQVAPNKRADGKAMQRAEELAPLFDQYADAFVKEKWSGERSTLNRQTFDMGDIAQDALHRSLSAEPAGVSAYKPIGDLTDGDRRALRDYFYAHVAKESPEHADLRGQLDKHLEDEPAKTTTDMFGDVTQNPDWSAWESARGELADKVRATGLGWPDYAKTMRGHEKAYATIQDLVRSKVSAGFAEHYNRLNPSAPLKLGRTVIRGNLNHLDAVDPAAREARLKAERQLIDSMRERLGGKYAAGGVAGKLEDAKEKKAAFEQAQMGFFASDDLFGGAGDDEKPAEKALATDERHTIGHAAERDIASMMSVVGHNFVPGQPVKLFHASMSGKDGAVRQRAIKFLKANKRMIGGLGVGSGKTGIGLGGFADLHSTGKVKKGVFVVPSIVQGQFGAEALRFLKPGQFSWHCEPGASHEDRLAAYKNPGTHFAVVTHQSFRDDILKIAARHEDSTPDAIAGKLDGMSQAERKAYIKGALDKEGINFDYVMADEGHGLLNRDGKENSRMSNAVQGVTDNAEYYLHASADPVKNDASEAFDLLAKMDGDRYSDKAAFMRRYGGDSVYAKEGLRRELARHAYTASLKPDVQVDRHVRNVELSPAQKAALDAVDRQVSAARMASLNGGVDVKSLRALAPASFEGASEDQHESIARGLTKALGVIHNSAVDRVINAHPESAKLDEVSAIAKEEGGKPGVVFARSLDAVQQLKERLEAEGHRVTLVTGKDSSVDKAAKIQQFNPDKGERKADIIICSDAGAVGANLQSGHWLAQLDTPTTAMTHAQRAGRVNRIGQKNGIRLYDLIANHPAERRARDRLEKKYALREVVTSPFESLDDTGVAAFLHHKQVAEAQNSLF